MTYGNSKVVSTGYTRFHIKWTTERFINNKIAENKVYARKYLSRFSLSWTVVVQFFLLPNRLYTE